MDLRGKIVLVTGASSGIGKAIALAFAQKHAHVLVHYGRNKVGAQETLKGVEKVSSGRLYQADLMESDAIKLLFDEIKRTTSTVDVLINNAAKCGRGTSTRTLYGSTNIKIFCCQRCVRVENLSRCHRRTCARL
jgi:3-oxoacyl-[acyl-carrier protein] reductase